MAGGRTRTAFHCCLLPSFPLSAAYCVMTYVLGVGDRHLDNLLVTTSGRIFHVDFAYLFGQGPFSSLPSHSLASITPFSRPDRHSKDIRTTNDGGRSEGVTIVYFFGKDPKPVSPPPMRLTRHMVQAMGGANSAGFEQFRQYCHSAYSALRR